VKEKDVAKREGTWEGRKKVRARTPWCSGVRREREDSIRLGRSSTGGVKRRGGESMLRRSRNQKTGTEGGGVKKTPAD